MTPGCKACRRTCRTPPPLKHCARSANSISASFRRSCRRGASVGTERPTKRNHLHRGFRRDRQRELTPQDRGKSRGPALFDAGAVLTAVKYAARRLRRWPPAMLDRGCARHPWNDQAGAKKRPQPNKETSRLHTIRNERGPFGMPIGGPFCVPIDTRVLDHLPLKYHVASHAAFTWSPARRARLCRGSPSSAVGL